MTAEEAEELMMKYPGLIMDAHNRGEHRTAWRNDNLAVVYSEFISKFKWYYLDRSFASGSILSKVVFTSHKTGWRISEANKYIKDTKIARLVYKDKMIYEIDGKLIIGGV